MCAVTDALPLLPRAKEVIVLSINPGNNERLPGAEIAESISEGDKLLSHTAEFGNDMIVMGACGNSRAAKSVFDGTARNLLQNSSIPSFSPH